MNSIIAEKIYENQEQNNTILKFFKKFSIGEAMLQSSFYKAKGAKPAELLKYLIGIVFRHTNIYLDTKYRKQPEMSKNTIYRFLSSTLYDWCKLLYLVAMNVIAFIIPLTCEDRKNVLIADDTLYSRSRSKKVDMLTRVFDHVTGKYVKGFKLLTLAWSDGNTTVPLKYRHIVSTNEKMVINRMPDDIDKRTRSYKLRSMAQQDQNEALFGLLDSLNLKALKVGYLLFDSWFAFPSVIMKACKRGLNVICMLKSMYRVYYTYKGQDYTLNDLFREAPRNRRHSAVISSIIVKIHNSEKSEQYARIVFLKSNNGNDWIALLSTDLTIPDTEIVRLYSKRWNIEVLFKFCKHCLKLDTELECRSFEALYAHTTIVFLRYIMLAFENRVAADDRTCGEIFFLLCDELKDISYLEALFLLLDTFADTIRGNLAVSNSQIDIMISVFIALIPQFFPVS